MSLKLLERIDEYQRNIITSSQVEMEFKKNRQAVILAAAGELKGPEGLGAVPTFLREAASVRILERMTKESKVRVKGLKNRVNKMMQNPTRVDPVYKCAQRLWRDRANVLHLSRNDEERFEVRALASKRFTLGYPPRKKNDISMGDAINWEWIVACAKDHGKHVVIVSRDGDFGPTANGGSYINDWLTQEFRERVARTRKVVLTAKLTEAFKLAELPVTEEEVLAEDKDVAAAVQSRGLIGAWFEQYMNESLLDAISQSRESPARLLFEKYLEVTREAAKKEP